MKARCLSLLATVLVAGSAAAQAPDESTVPPGHLDVLTGVATPRQTLPAIPVQPRIYLENSANKEDTRRFDNGSAFGVYRTDPRLIVGFRLTPNLALETGYTNLVNRGHYLADYTRPDDVAGALGVKGFNSYVAGRLTLPLGEQLQLFSKVGLAYSNYKRPVLGQIVSESDLGPYISVGLQYQLGKKASLVGAYERYGNTAQKWGGNTNNNGVSVKFNMQF